MNFFDPEKRIQFLNIVTIQTKTDAHRVKYLEHHYNRQQFCFFFEICINVNVVVVCVLVDGK